MDFSFGLKGGVEPTEESLIEFDKEEEKDGIKQDTIQGELIIGKGPILFQESIMFMGSEDGESPYKGSQGLNNQKWGQLKLFIELLLTILYYCESNIKKIIYIGAMEGTNIAMCAKMFPLLHFDLYDLEQLSSDGIMRRFDERLRKLKNVTIYNKYFTDSDIDMYKKELSVNAMGEKVCMLISDIRSITYSNSTKKEREIVAWRDMELQESWVLKLNPQVASLKMRLPYYIEDVIEKGKTRKYLDGVVMRQAYNSKTSSETRLIVRGINYREWDLLAYEQKCAYFNYFVRPHTFKNIFGNDDNYSDELGLNLKFDSTLFMFSLQQYLISTGRKSNQRDCIRLAKYIIEFLGKGKRNLIGGEEIEIEEEED